jgi:DNA-binding NarL/FixJ family response regulator
MTRKIRILLADDHTVLREATAELIENQPDMQVIGQAGTGEEAVTQVEASHPDVVVMDISMPRLAGLEATQRILAECPETRVLVLSAHEDVDHVIPLLEAGAIGYLSKTVSLNELLDAIRSASQGISVLPPSIASVVVEHIADGPLQDTKGILTEREMQVLRLVSLGYTNDQIAHQLHLSTRTIESHLTHIYNKLGVSSRTEAALLAQRRGWLSSE